MAKILGYSFVLVILLVSVNSAFAQEWEYVMGKPGKPPDPSPQPSVVRFNDIFYFDPSNAVGLDTSWTKCRIVRTSDGGKTWDTRFTFTEGVVPFDVFFLDAQKGWAVGRGGVILHTEDSGFSWQELSNVGLDIGSVYFVDASKGWIIARGPICSIYHTEDGGITWIKQYETQLNTYLSSGMYFINELKGWVLGWANDSILHTEDGGKTWEEQKSNIEGQNLLYDVRFLSEDVGWIIDWEGNILHTEDGGKHWHRQDSGTKERLRCIDVINADEAWVVGWDTILHTKDGGKTWQKAGDGIPTCDLMKVQFFNPNEGYIASWWGGIYHTIDGGITWQTVHEPKEVVYNAFNDPAYQVWHGRKVYFANENTGWLLAEPGGPEFKGLIIHAADKGKTLEQQNTTNNVYFNGISFIDENEGWVVGSYYNIMKGIILHTRNGGVDWEQINTLEEWIQDVHFINSREGCIAAFQQIYYTNSGGKTWKSVTPQELPGCWRNLDFVDLKHGWAVYCQGQIAYTEDGGKSWELIDRTIKSLEKVDFVNEQEGWGIGSRTRWDGDKGVGSDGLIFHTEDGGKSWIEVFKVDDSFIKDLCFVNNNEGWVVGFSTTGIQMEDGFILHTTDGGMTWNEQHRVENKTLMSICYDGDSSLYAVGQGNCLLRYTDPSIRSGQAVDSSDKLVVTWGKIKSQLYQNYPNPFNPETWIPYQLGEDTEATISIYNTSGQLVRILELGNRKAGSYQAHWDGMDDKGQTLASGVYFYILKTEKDYTNIKKMVFLK